MNELSWKTKAAIAAVIISILAGLIFIIKYQHDLIERQKSIETSIVGMKQFQDGSVRNEGSYATKQDVEKFAKSTGVDLKPIQDDLAKLDAKLQGVSQLVALTPGIHETNLSSSNKTPRTDKPPPIKCSDGVCPDVYGYQSNTQNLLLAEPLSSGGQIPFGEVHFSAWKKAPWGLDIYPRKYSVATVIGMDEDGRHYVYSKFFVDSHGKQYVMPITQSKFVEEYPDAKFRFSPELYLSVNGGMIATPPVRAEVIPALEIALFSYGKTKINPTWNFVSVGFGYESQLRGFGFIFSPVNYNLGDNLPLINNLYIGPSVSIDFGGNVGFYGSLRVGL